jgi:CCR4-NOT transcriptional regulation complex NOT5 subunit
MAYVAPDFTTTAIVNGNTKIQDVDEQVNQLMDDVETYMNDNLGEAANLAEGYKDEASASASASASSATEASQSASSASSDADKAEAAKEAIESYVIPTEATYNPETIEDKIRRIKTLKITGA